MESGAKISDCMRFIFTFVKYCKTERIQFPWGSLVRDCVLRKMMDSFVDCEEIKAEMNCHHIILNPI